MIACPSCGRDNPDGFRFCGFCQAQLPAADAVEVRKTVSVVFVDLTDFTPLSERMDPEQVRGIVGRFLEEMKAIAERHGGTVEKFAGDAVMAVFGIPVVHEDDALRAVRTTREMHAAVSSLNEEFERDHGVRIRPTPA